MTSHELQDVNKYPDEKPIESLAHQEYAPAASDTASAKNATTVAVPQEMQLKSVFDELGMFRTARVFWKASLICALCAFSAAADGYQIGLTGNIIANRGFINTFGTTVNAKGQVILAAKVLSVWGGLQSLGQAMGMITMYYLCDKFGRRVAFWVFWLALFAAVAFETWGRTWVLWLFAKLTAGYAVGSLQFVHSLYITEVAPTKIRGFLLVTYSFWYSLGQLFAPLALQQMLVKDPNNYLTLVYTEWAMVGIMFLIYLALPESPWFYAITGKHEKGIKTLRWLNGGVVGYDVEKEYDIIRNTVDMETARKKASNTKEDFFAIFKGIDAFRTFISFLPTALQQFTGVAVISTYSSYFFQTAGVSDPFTNTVILAVLGICASLFVALGVDKLGRRVMVLIAVTVAWLCLVAIGILGVTPINGASGKLLLFFACMWKFGNQMLGAMGWPCTVEFASAKNKSKVGAFSSAAAVAFGVCFSSTVPYMLNTAAANWSLKTCFFFAGISAPLVLAAFFCIPDTARRSPAEVDELFETKVRPWRFHKTITSVEENMRREKESAEIGA